MGCITCRHPPVSIFQLSFRLRSATLCTIHERICFLSHGAHSVLCGAHFFCIQSPDSKLHKDRNGDERGMMWKRDESRIPLNLIFIHHSHVDSGSSVADCDQRSRGGR